MKLFLTEKTVNSLALPPGKQRLTVSDLGCPGLSLEVRLSGEGSWRYRYTFNKIQQCLTLGLASELSLAQARERYFEFRQVFEAGDDPRHLMHPNPLKSCPTFGQFGAGLYIPYIKGYKKCVSADETLLKNHLLPRFGTLRMNQISRLDISQFISEKHASGYKPAYCNRFWSFWDSALIWL